MKWIDPKEQLPKINEKILIYGISEHGVGPCVWLGWYEEDGFFLSETLAVINAAFWCSIPKIPTIEHQSVL